MASLIQRVLLYQFLLLFVYLRLTTFDESKKDFRKRVIYYIQKFTGYPKSVLDLFLGDFELYFKIFLLTAVVSAVFSIIGFRVFKVLSGIITILIAMLYCNPIVTISKAIKTKSNDWVDYLPTIEFLALFALGIGMIATLAITGEFDYDDEEEELLKMDKKNLNKNKAKKLKTKCNDKANNQTKKVRYNSLFSFEDFFNKLFLVLDASAFALICLFWCHF